MTLGEKQRKFANMVGRLITVIYGSGYECTLGHALRCPDCPTGKKKSFHKNKLAIDINLFLDGVYLTRTEDHEKFGLFWESIGGSWGGRFKHPETDGNHYSLGE